MDFYLSLCVGHLLSVISIMFHNQWIINSWIVSICQHQSLLPHSNQVVHYLNHFSCINSANLNLLLDLAHTINSLELNKGILRAEIICQISFFSDEAFKEAELNYRIIQKSLNYVNGFSLKS